MTDESVPFGATHMIPANPLDFNPTVEYMRWAPTLWLPESCRWLYGWYYYDRAKKSWVRDPIFSNRRNILVPIKSEQGNPS